MGVESYLNRARQSTWSSLGKHCVESVIRRSPRPKHFPWKRRVKIVSIFFAPARLLGRGDERDEAGHEHAAALQRLSLYTPLTILVPKWSSTLQCRGKRASKSRKTGVSSSLACRHQPEAEPGERAAYKFGCAVGATPASPPGSCLGQRPLLGGSAPGGKEVRRRGCGDAR